MKVFISWSGPFSKTNAEAFRTSVQIVFPDVDFFVSSQDIEMGERGIEKIEENLSVYDFGIIFLSRDTIAAPWLYYEAGALSRSLKESRNRIVPLLIDCSIDEIGNTPLSFYQGCELDREGLKSVCASINSLLAKPRNEETFGTLFDTFWSKFESIIRDIEKPVEKRGRVTNESLAAEISEIKRMMIRLQNNIATSDILAKNRNIRNFLFPRTPGENVRAEDIFDAPPESFADLLSDRIVKDLVSRNVPRIDTRSGDTDGDDED